LDNYVIVKYIRLSLDDTQSESMSIENQRLMLDGFIADMDCCDAPALEFVDNGFTGTNFERPGVQELLELVREGKVDCIVVKDFSRFGRNAIETGYFIERVFPFYRVRFISLDDGFDSAEHDGDTGGLEVSFKFLMHEYYSRDLSKKISSARREKMRRGEAVTKNCVFGYSLDANRNMVVDPVAADTVQLIFNMYSQEHSLLDIEKRLYKEKRATPSVHKKQKRALAKDGQFACVWQKSVINKILRDEQYIGTYIAGKTRVVDPVAHSHAKTDSADWIRIPGHHPAIIPQTLFDRVQEKLRNKRKPLQCREAHTNTQYVNHTDSPLKGKVFCGHCGHSLHLSYGKNAAFHCSFTRSAPDTSCFGLRTIKAELENAIFKMISQQANVILNIGDLKNIEACDKVANRKSDCLNRIEKCHDMQRGLYERMILGEMDTEEYMAEKASVEVELDRLEQVRISLSTETRKQSVGAGPQSAANIAAQADGLTRELVDLLVEKVLLYSNGRLEVHWKITDFGNTTGHMEDGKNVG